MLLRGLKELKTVAHFASLRPFVGGRAVFGDGRRRLAAEESGCGGAARVLVARAAFFQPYSGLRCGLRLSASGRQLPRRGGPGSLGRAGSSEQGVFG